VLSLICLIPGSTADFSGGAPGNRGQSWPSAPAGSLQGGYRAAGATTGLGLGFVV